MPTSIDLFCGAGGLTLGLGRAGFDARLGSDNWGPAVATFGANFPRVPVLDADALELSAADLLAKAGLDAAPDLVSGGPPCQGFSSAGAKGRGDPRNTLVSVYARLAAEIRPPAILFENVEGFLTSHDGRFVIGLLDPLIEAGYHVSLEKLNVANFGVPQLRKRVVAIAVLAGDPPPLTPTHRAWGAPGVHRATADRTLEPTPTVEQALSGLPAPSADPPGTPADHYVPPVSDADKERITALLPGQRMRDLPEHLWQPSYRRRAHRRVMDGTPLERRGGAPAGLRRLVAGEPSRAITSSAAREFVHPAEDRPLTLREATRLQTFPDDFVLAGPKAYRHALIGNAVPPLFAEAIGGIIRDHLASVNEPENRTGALVRFRPTLSDTISPALARVVRMVRSRYLGG
jgi:DNA (cytosine-5)-methyltransferase 1